MTNASVESRQPGSERFDGNSQTHQVPSHLVAQREAGGQYLLGDALKLLSSDTLATLRGKVQLILTSPPFPLNDKKSYGNRKGQAYLDWFISLAPLFSELLTEDGSIVIELGNSWESGRPVQSLLHLESLLGFAKHPTANLRLIQQFVCYNPSRLPSPAAWVTVRRIRTVDSFTHVWWFSKTDYPKADSSQVLRPYSKSMRGLLRRGKYNAGKRPSEHKISKRSFLRNHGGAVPHNFFELEALDPSREVRLPNAFAFSNTVSNDFFHRECKKRKLTLHPARMPLGLASFFVQFLTSPGDLVLDPFAGSNTTGFSAALNGRTWLSIDTNENYVEQSIVRFEDPALGRAGRKP